MPKISPGAEKGFKILQIRQGKSLFETRGATGVKSEILMKECEKCKKVKMEQK